MSTNKSDCGNLFFAEQFKAERKRRSLTQDKFAEIYGITKSYVSKIESGEKEPSETLKLLFEALAKEQVDFISEPFDPRDGDQIKGQMFSEEETGEDSPPMVRNYRDLALMDADTLGEIQTWINDMERFRPGFASWFRLEFQNRFPEFDDWKNRLVKKRTGTGN